MVYIIRWLRAYCAAWVSPFADRQINLWAKVTKGAACRFCRAVGWGGVSTTWRKDRALDGQGAEGFPVPSLLWRTELAASPAHAG